MPHRDELLDGKVNATLRPISPTAFRSTAGEEMQKLNGTDAFSISNGYRTTPCWCWPATQSLRR